MSSAKCRIFVSRVAHNPSTLVGTQVVSNPWHGFDTLHSALDTQLNIKIHGCKDFDGTKLGQCAEEVG